MKIITTSIVFLVSLFCFGRIMPEQPKYTIVSDQFDASIVENTCVVEGYVSDWKNKGIAYGTVATMNRSASAHTDSAGFYSMTIASSDTSIFFYHPQHSEVVIWQYQFKSQHRVKINFYPSTYEMHQNVKKPVIYLYAPEETNFDIKLVNASITHLYPKCNDSWNVRTQANGDLIDLKTNKVYPYLFWEGERTDLVYQQQENKVYGNLVATDSLIAFFESSLNQIGLNSNEQADFITFWAPVLLRSNYVFIQFLLDEDYNSTIASLSINPLPESQRRVFMQFTFVENAFVPFDFVAQEFSKFDRTGSTLIEWGGSEIEFRTNPD